MSIFNYNPDTVSVLVAGFIPIKGFVDGTFIECSKDLMPFTSQRTSDGMVSRVYVNDQTWTITITLHCGSESNDLFTKLWQLDELTKKGKFPLLVKDGSGSDLLFSATTWIEGVPSISKSADVDTRTWTLKSSQAVTNIGSNSNPSGLLEDITNIAIASLPSLAGLI